MRYNVFSRSNSFPGAPVRIEDGLTHEQMSEFITTLANEAIDRGASVQIGFFPLPSITWKNSGNYIWVEEV